MGKNKFGQTNRGEREKQMGGEWGQTNGGVEIKSNFTIQVLAAFGDF